MLKGDVISVHYDLEAQKKKDSLLNCIHCHKQLLFRIRLSLAKCLAGSVDHIQLIVLFQPQHCLNCVGTSIEDNLEVKIAIWQLDDGGKNKSPFNLTKCLKTFNTKMPQALDRVAIESHATKETPCPTDKTRS